MASRQGQLASRAVPGARSLLLPALLLVLAGGLAPIARADITSYARVLDDATLQVGRRHVRLHGIYVPPSGRTCRSNLSPVRCASRAVLALEFRIRGFVRCEEKARYDDGSVSAVCSNDDVDLGAYLIERGWAVAVPDAPFHYHVLEDIARERNMGVWGFHADRIEAVSEPR